MLTSTDVSCNGEAEQLQYLFLEEFPYTYHWSTGSTTDTNTISDLTAGATVTVKDALNKVITSTFTVNEPSVIVIPSTKEASILLCFLHKTLAGNVSGGVLPYTYKWSNMCYN
jgi:hypothetical protein